MNIIKFLPQQGGNIRFEIDPKYATCERYGTSVELGRTFLAMVPWNPTANAGRYVDLDVISIIPVESPQFIGTFVDTQDYAGQYQCWVEVDVFDLQELLDICPEGWALAECTETLNKVKIERIYQ